MLLNASYIILIITVSSSCY